MIFLCVFPWFTMFLFPLRRLRSQGCQHVGRRSGSAEGPGETTAVPLRERALRKSLRNNEKTMGKPWEIPYKQWGFIEKSWTYMGKSLVKIVDSRLINDLFFVGNPLRESMGNML